MEGNTLSFLQLERFPDWIAEMKSTALALDITSWEGLSDRYFVGLDSSRLLVPRLRPLSIQRSIPDSWVGRLYLATGPDTGPAY